MLTKTDEYFITIAKTGNLNRAASLLYVSQPSLTKYIQRLEERLGTELFDHSVTPLHLNDAGELYLHFLLDSQEREQNFFDKIGEIRQMERGTLHIGVPPYCGQCYLPKVLPTFSKRYPQVAVDLVEGTGGSLETALINQEIDLAIVHSPVNNPLLAYTDLITENILLVTKKRDSRTGIIESNIEKFSKENFILPYSDQKIGKIVDKFLSQKSFIPKIYMRTSSVETVILLASQGIGIGFIPDSGLQSLSHDIQKRYHFSL